MRCTLLGSGEAVGVPAPLCDCRYCEASERRRRPALLVETAESTVVLDAGPDVVEALHEVGVRDVDAFFVTHHHFDHVGGLHKLHHAAMGFDRHVGVAGDHLDPDPFTDAEKPTDPEFSVYLSDTARGHLRDAAPHLADELDLRGLEHERSVAVGDLRVVPFPVEHARPAFDTLGFAVNHDDERVVYAPDMWEWGDTEAYADPDLLFVEGAALFRAYGHGDEADLRASIRAADADRTVLVNLNEHLQRLTTAELRESAAADGFELGRDLRTYRP